MQIASLGHTTKHCFVIFAEAMRGSGVLEPLTTTPTRTGRWTTGTIPLDGVPTRQAMTIKTRLEPRTATVVSHGCFRLLVHSCGNSSVAFRRRLGFIHQQHVGPIDQQRVGRQQAARASLSIRISWFWCEARKCQFKRAAGQERGSRHGQ